MHTIIHKPAHIETFRANTSAIVRGDYVPHTWEVVFMCTGRQHEIESFDNKNDAYALCNYLNGGQQWQPLPEPVAGKDGE